MDGFKFCTNKELLGTIGGVKIDVSYMGFIVDPVIPLASPSSGSSCSSCGSGASCSI